MYRYTKRAEKWLKGRHFSKFRETRMPAVLLDGSITCSFRILAKNGDMTRVVTYFVLIQTTRIVVTCALSVALRHIRANGWGKKGGYA